MKNILAENLLRFGVKNLSEAQMQRLTEAEIDLLNTPGIDKANKYFQTAYKNQVPDPSYILGQYYLKSDRPVNYESDMSISGPVYGFYLYTVGSVSLPLISYGSTGEGGRWTFFSRDNKITKIYWDTYRQSFQDPKMAAKDIAYNINARFNEVPLKALQTIYNAHPKKANFDQAMATFKASTAPWKTMLTGNAKTFFGV